MAKRVYYCGHSRDGVTVGMPSGPGEYVAWGAALETTAEHASSLLEQVDNWAASAPATAGAAEKPKRARASRTRTTPAAVVETAPESAAGEG